MLTTLLSGPYAILARISAWALAVAAIAGFGYFKGIQHEATKTQAVQAEFATFKGNVLAEGQKARHDALLQSQADLKRKETADADLKVARAAAATAYDGWVRLAKARASGGYLPAPAANSPNPEVACFARGKLESILGGLDAEGTRIAGEGDGRQVDMDAARRWADGQ